METVKTIIENTKETVLSAVGMNQPTTDDTNQQISEKSVSNDEHDLKNSPTTMETVKEVVNSAVEKAKELTGLGVEKTSDLKEAIMNLKDTTTQKVSELTNFGNQESDSEAQKMKNWNESISKIEESHHAPLHPTHESHQSEQTTDSGDSSNTEGIQQKLVQMKDTAVENLGYVKEVASQKFVELQNAVTSQLPSSNSTTSNPFQSTVTTAKDLLEKGKETISNLATGTSKDEQQLKHTQPADQSSSSFKEKATEKIEEWTEGGLGNIGVIDSVDKKETDSIKKNETAVQPNQDPVNLSA